jgi:threonine dehydrogenase-like Zn-dependent dehydrogenase
MQAIVVEPPVPGSALREVPTPRAGPREVRVAMLEAGICGTDRDIVEGKYGTPPAGSNTLILGHENLGVVESVGSKVRSLSRGDLVVSTVRRGCGKCGFCASGRSDFCTTGLYTERGIKGRDGYIAEFYVERPEYIVRVPATLRSTAVLLEPLSVVVKAYQQLVAVRARFLHGGLRAGRVRPRSLVTGTGAVGMLATLVLRSEGWDVIAVSRHAASGVILEVLQRVGASHVEVSSGLDALGDAHFDAIFEASGSGSLDLQLPGRLASNGVAVLTGIPSAGEPAASIAAGALFRTLVLQNQAIVGSVNANRSAFASGVSYLRRFRRRFGTVTEKLVTARVPWTTAPQVLSSRAPGSVKTVLVFPPVSPNATNVK